MPTIIKNDIVSKTVLQLDFAGGISLQPAEIARVLEWVKDSPIADHIVVRFNDMSQMTGDRILGGIIEAHVAHEEAIRALHFARSELINQQLKDVLNAGNDVPTR